jgi:hypothetical protein
MVPQAQDMHPTAGVTGLLSLFEQFPLVALGEVHRLEQEATFIAELVRHPTFPRLVQAIVVEWGNSLHQEVVDRYVGGETVSSAALCQVWRDFSGRAPWGFVAPIYEQFFHIVRAVNESLTSERRIRVLLAAPPVDWQALGTPEYAGPLPFDDRDAPFAEIVEREVLSRGQRALLIAGYYHFLRRGPERENVTNLLDRHHPSATYVVIPHSDLATVETRLESWPVPGLVSVQGTWLGALPASTLVGESTSIGSETISDLMDGYLYLGPTATHTYSPREDPALYADEVYMSEIKRRLALLAQIYGAEIVSVVGGSLINL